MLPLKMKPKHSESQPNQPRRRRWAFRLAAILLGFSPFLLLEIALRGLGLPSSPPPVDPYIDLHNLRPLFQLNATTDQLEISPERMNLFRPAKFAASKPPGTFRIFALGGSTTQGEPYATETAFPEWLRLNLQAAVGNEPTVEAINCGGLSYASYRVLAILREVLNYSPDLIVIYTGHNEYLEYRTYAGYRQPNATQRWFGWLSGWHTVQLARSLAGQTTERATASDQPHKTELKSEVDALLDYQGGLTEYRRGDAWYEPIPAHFRWNLEQMVSACQAAHVPLLLVRPVSNLIDCPPLKFEVDPQLSLEDRARFEAHWEAARSGAATVQQSLAEIKSALSIDPQHAGANYLLGQRQFEAGDFAPALTSLQRAKDYDVCPLRAPTSICESVTEVAHRYRTPLVDAEFLFADRSHHGLVGNRWLVDHIHPNLEGHQLLGEELAQLCFEKEIFPAPVGDWKIRRQKLFNDHLSQLNEAYFQRGKQRLAGLLLWTQGRAKKIKE